MNFPLDLRFKLLAFSSQIAVRDAEGRLLFWVKQKAFKLKEDIVVYGDEEMSQPLYRIQANKVIDFSAKYTITDTTTGKVLGVIGRQGMRSIWRARYDIERDGQRIIGIQEENPWVKIADHVLGELPVLGLLTGYLFHPAYRVTRAATDTLLLRVVKQPAFFEGRFRIEAGDTRLGDDDTVALLGVLMMVLLERRRG